MNEISIGGAFSASEIALGCWRMGGMEDGAAAALVGAALEQGINFFDTADIYGRGESERRLGRALAALCARERAVVQTKCGIRNGFYDFSMEHIVSSAEESLKRLGTEYIDVLLLHRPDALIEPEDVAEAFERLYTGGKVRWFGVSNFNQAQIELLQSYTSQKLIANQLQLSVASCTMIDRGLLVNTPLDGAVDRDGAVLDYCRRARMTVQAWSPLQYGFFKGTFLEDYENFPELNKKLEEVGAAHGISKAAAAIAWLLRHPARIQVIAGTTRPERLTGLCAASGVRLSREEWYGLYTSAGKILP